MAPAKPKPLVVISLLGTTLDSGRGHNRWNRWRPTVSLCQHQDVPIARLELIHQSRFSALAEGVAADIAQVSPATRVNLHCVDHKDPWDFEEMYASLHDFARGYLFDTDEEDYLVHITTGTHVAQICLFLLTESRHFPARLVQTGLIPTKREEVAGVIKIIDLDLSRYDSIAARFEREHVDNVTSLKSGIATRNAAFNRLIEEVEHVSIHSTEPILLMGPTGAGKSQLARRIYELKKAHHQIEGPFIEVNCATLRGDAAMSALFGHKKGAFTGALQDRPGLLRAADGGLLFLDEVGELGLDEQAMLLRAVEERRFLPLGADKEVGSNFRLIAGTNRDLLQHVQAGRFRDDLLARMNLWTFRLPALRERLEDIEPNLDYELEQFAKRSGRSVRFNTEARRRFLSFATSPAAVWSGNFRDLSAAVTRTATMAAGGRITEDVVAAEIKRLEHAWRKGDSDAGDWLNALLGMRAADLDLFDRVQLAEVVRVCRRSGSLSAAGRELFSASRQKKAAVNDADRLRKYLARFGLNWASIQGIAPE
jgi:transcriptional regulatory protein RtcR